MIFTRLQIIIWTILFSTILKRSTNRISFWSGFLPYAFKLQQKSNGSKIKNPIWNGNEDLNSMGCGGGGGGDVTPSRFQCRPNAVVESTYFLFGFVIPTLLAYCIQLVKTLLLGVILLSKFMFKGMKGECTKYKLCNPFLVLFKTF